MDKVPVLRHVLKALSYDQTQLTALIVLRTATPALTSTTVRYVRQNTPTSTLLTQNCH